MAVVMSAMSYAIFFLGASLEVCLVARLLCNGLWRRYAYFFSYVLYTTVCAFFQFGIWTLFPELYRDLYWGSESIGMVLSFFVVWEVFRQTFPRGSILNKILFKGFAITAFGLAIVCVSLYWSVKTYHQYHAIYPALERSFGFVQAVLMLGVLLMARYYALPLGRNLWGVAIAFGAWVSITTANNALIDWTESFRPYWSVVSRLSFIAVNAVWLWALWNYAPNPLVSSDRMTAEASAAELNEWAEGWNRTVSTTRKIIHP
jgi:hypothetical protein